MKHIKKLTVTEKSVLLAKARGWRVVPVAEQRLLILHPKRTFELGLADDNFYSPRFWWVVWEFMNWVSDTAAGVLEETKASEWIDEIDRLLMDRWRNSSLAEAQADILDKILELVVEAGMVQP